MKKLSKILVLLLALSIVLCSCGAKSQPAEEAAMDFAYTAAPEEPMMAAAPAPMAGAKAFGSNGKVMTKSTASVARDITANPALQDRKIVYSANLSMETKEYEKALNAIYGVIDSYGAYIQSQSESNASLYDQYSRFNRSINLTVRVPVEDFNSLIDGVSLYCNVTNKNIYSNDITDSYFDTDIHLQTLKTEEQTLLNILEKATNLNDVIQLQTALADTRYQIESLEAQLRRMDKQVSYSTVDIYLQEVVEYTDVSHQLTFGERISSAFKRSGQNIKNFFQNIILWIIRELPVKILWLALIAAIAKVLIVIVKKIIKKKTSKNEDE